MTSFVVSSERLSLKYQFQVIRWGKWAHALVWPCSNLLQIYVMYPNAPGAWAPWEKMPSAIWNPKPVVWFLPNDWRCKYWAATAMTAGRRRNRHDRMWKRVGGGCCAWSVYSIWRERLYILGLSCSGYVTTTGKRTPEQPVSKHLCSPSRCWGSASKH